MNEAQKDTARAIDAARSIIDGRDIFANEAAVLVTLEHTVATVLLALYPHPYQAMGMLNDGLVPGVKTRLVNNGSKKK